MTDQNLRQDIYDQLDYEPSLDAGAIGVAVDDGIVTLTGHTVTYLEKVTATQIVESIRGVCAITNKIVVQPDGPHLAPDADIARRIAKSLKWNTAVPEERIHVTVRSGCVTLEGEVGWHYQAEAAAQTVHRLSGVIAVHNHIRVRQSPQAADVLERIRRAFLRDAELEASGIRVSLDNGTATLEGTVRHLGECRSAERAAWAAPGITKVVDRLRVQ